MKEIVSQNNRWVKLIRKLKEKKYRDAEGLYVIEGPNLLEDAVRNNEEIVMIGVGSQSAKNGIQSIELPNNRIFLFPAEIFMGLTDTVTSQNVLAVIKKNDRKPEGGGNRFIVLDGLQDPGNVGTVIRTAEAAGFTGVIAVRCTADIYSPKVVRAAAGSLFRIAIIEDISREESLDYLNNKGIRLFACDSGAEDSYTKVDIRENIGIIVGNEGNGVSKFFLENSHAISIPMNSETESLNAAVAAGIVIYESVRQRNG